MKSLILKIGVGLLLVVVGMIWLSNRSYEKALAPAVEAIMAAPAINTSQELEAACNIATSVAKMASACYMGDYPIVYRGHRLNFTEVRIDGYRRGLDGQGHKEITAILALDRTRKVSLVRYQHYPRIHDHFDGTEYKRY